jgi:hypothetical protein
MVAVAVRSAMHRADVLGQTPSRMRGASGNYLLGGIHMTGEPISHHLFVIRDNAARSDIPRFIDSRWRSRASNTKALPSFHQQQHYQALMCTLMRRLCDPWQIMTTFPSS